MRGHATITALVAAGMAIAAGASADAVGQAGVGAPPAGGPPWPSEGIDDAVRRAMSDDHLKALLVRISANGRIVYERALGQSMADVPATADMHFRNGAMAFAYIATLLLELVDQRRVSLDDPLSKWFPELPHAAGIKLLNLANMTSGYADYVYQPELLHGLGVDPFRHWTPAELVRIGMTAPMMFDPGRNWGYCHTNYVILGRVLEKITGLDLGTALDRFVIGPMGLHETQGSATPRIPEPVMHGFSAERRGDLGIAAGIPFYEESTFWNPSWTTAEGAVETTDIADFLGSIEAVATGRLLSRESFMAQVGPNLVGFGHAAADCAACRPMTDALNYGLGVVNIGPWVTETKSFAGNDATAGYLASAKVGIAVMATYAPAAFGDAGQHDGATIRIFQELGNLLAPGSVPRP